MRDSGVTRLEKEYSMADAEMAGTEMCPVCKQGGSVHYADVQGIAYLRCESCRSIHATTAVLDEIDAGRPLMREYGAEYWKMELAAARTRAQGVSLCRAGEAILYCRRPVRRFLDIGAGPGFLLEKLLELLDPDAATFHAVEKFAPAEHFEHPNYHAGTLADLHDRFDAGVCIEVVEHLTPTMLRTLVSALADVSHPDSYWLFNTGMDEYVVHEDANYLDPYRRGHIVSYSIKGLQSIFEPHGFVVQQLPGKSYAFAAEFRPQSACAYDERIYRPLAENKRLLERNPLLFHAVFESARSSFYYAGYLERSAWAVSLDVELNKQRERDAERKQR